MTAMGLDFVQNYGGCRVDQYNPQPPLWDEPPDDEQEQDEDRVNLDYEIDRADWEVMSLNVSENWRPGDWPERPVRFVDGKDVGRTIAWLLAPGGYPVPVRLSEIGSVVMRVVDGECRREFAVTERVVSMVADVFPWDEVESFAAALQANGFRLLSAYPPSGIPSYDFEKMRKAAQNRSNDEMGVLEEAALAQEADVPSVVDGRLEPRQGGFDPAQSPVFGVIKTHYKNYLHPLGMQLLYQLEVGQRTPTFSLPKEKLPVISWYLRLSGGGAIPNWGLVRIEVPMQWFESHGCDWDFVDRLSRTIYEYRCREHSYRRASVSLHPIVRAEESLGSLFFPTSAITNQFYRLTGL
jgi:hypothetical protein